MRKGLGPLVPAVQADLALTLGARGQAPETFSHFPYVRTKAKPPVKGVAIRKHEKTQ